MAKRFERGENGTKIGRSRTTSTPTARAHDGGGSRIATVTDDDGTLEVEFQREQGDPVVAGIEILRIGEDTESSAS